MTSRIQRLHTHADEDGPFDHIENSRVKAFLEALAVTGVKSRAAEAVGVDRSFIYAPMYWNDPTIRAAVGLAEEMAADNLVREAHRRAVEGVARPAFDRKTGAPLQHPDTCDCGHDRREWHSKVEHEQVGPVHGPCAHPECRGCEGFVGAPVYEHEYSDRLLELLLRGLVPERFSDSLTVRGLVAKIDYTQLPNVVLRRVSAGEDLQSVLASVIAGGGVDADQVRRALPPGVAAAKAVGRPRSEREIAQGINEANQPNALDENLDPGDEL